MEHEFQGVDKARLRESVIKLRKTEGYNGIQFALLLKTTAAKLSYIETGHAFFNKDHIDMVLKEWSLDSAEDLIKYTDTLPDYNLAKFSAAFRDVRLSRYKTAEDIAQDLKPKAIRSSIDLFERTGKRLSEGKVAQLPGTLGLTCWQEVLDEAQRIRSCGTATQKSMRGKRHDSWSNGQKASFGEVKQSDSHRVTSPQSAKTAIALTHAEHNSVRWVDNYLESRAGASVNHEKS